MADTRMVEFIHALRGAGVRISTSESMDAIRTAMLLGYQDKQNLKSGLSLVLAKTQRETCLFEDCFERFFTAAGYRASESDANVLGNNAPDISARDVSIPQSGSGTGNGGGGSGESQGASPASSQRTFQQNGELAALLLAGDTAAIQMSMSRAAQAVNLSQIRVMTQRGIYSRRILLNMGLEQLEEDIQRLGSRDDMAARLQGIALQNALNGLRQTVSSFVAEQLSLLGAGSRRLLQEEAMMDSRLSQLQLLARERQQLKRLINRLAKRLVNKYSRRQRRERRGILDARLTLQRNIRHDGVMFKPCFKSRKVNRTRLMVVCDVSGSVSAASRFLLMFLYSLVELVPDMRAFVFSNRLGEVTREFETHDVDEAIDAVLELYGMGSTDYGRALTGFQALAGRHIDKKTSIIILGDGRNNRMNPRAEILQLLKKRSRQIFWLNPEPRSQWGSGDSEMLHFLPHVSGAYVCSTLSQLERCIEQLIRQIKNSTAG